MVGCTGLLAHASDRYIPPRNWKQQEGYFHRQDLEDGQRPPQDALFSRVQLLCEPTGLFERLIHDDAPVHS